MSERYTISQLARAAEVPTTTVRYYERIGLVQPEDRSTGNYRLYGDESLRKLKFIRSAQSIGFSLDNVQALLGDGDSLPCCGDVRQLIEDRLAEVDQRLKDLRQIQRVLKNTLATCQTRSTRQACPILETLKTV